MFLDSFHNTVSFGAYTIGWRDSGDTDTVDITLSYDTASLPYFQRYGIVTTRLIGTDETTSVQDQVIVYFTPYGTVEVWSDKGLASLYRMWEKPYKPEPSRVFIHSDSIPVTNVDPNDTSSYIDSNYQLSKVEGLPYAVVMQPIDPVLVSQYYDSINASSAIALVRIFTGTIAGDITTTITNDRGITMDVPVVGALVYVAETRGLTSVLTETHTDENGHYELSYSALRFGINEIPLELHVVAQNREFLERVEVIEIDRWVGGLEKRRYPTASRIDLGKVDVDGGDMTQDINFTPAERKERDAFYMLTWAVLAKKMIQSELGLDINKKLQIVPAFNGSFYFSVKEKGNETIGSNRCQWQKLQTVEIWLNRADASHESVIQHEFMHYFMDYLLGWQLDIEDGLLKAADADHRSDRDIDGDGNENWQMAFNEGFATGMAGVLDIYHKDFDGEWTRQSLVENPEEEDEFDQRENLDRSLLNNGAGGNTLTNEYHFSYALFDLFDGPANHTLNSTTNIASVAYNDEAPSGATAEDVANVRWEPGEVDNVELSLLQILQPIIDNDIESVDEYYHFLIKSFADCDTKRKIRKVFIQNRIGLESLTYEADGNYINSDEIGTSVEADDLRHCSKGFGDDFVAFFDEHDFVVDRSELSTSVSLDEGVTTSPMPLCDDLEISNTGTLRFNENGVSTLVSPICSELVEITGGGKFIVGKATNTASQNAHITLSSGSTVRSVQDAFNNKPIIRVNNNSHLIIEEGATLRIGQGTQINLDGPNAVLEIRGNLVLEDGAVFAPVGGPNGQGFVRFNTAIYDKATAIAQMQLGDNSRMTFAGTGANKVLEVQNHTLWLDAQSNTFTLEILDGLVEMGEGTMINTTGEVLLDGATVSLLPGAAQWQGIFTWGKSPEVKNSTINNAKVGLGVYNTSGGFTNLTSISNSTFNNVEKGLVNNGRGFTVFNSHFNNVSTTGIEALGQVYESNFRHSNVDDATEEGIHFTTSTAARLNVRNSLLFHNQVGVKFEGLSLLTMNCTQVQGDAANNATGTEISKGHLILNNRGGRGGGTNTFSNNLYNIHLEDRSIFHLDRGNNKLSNYNGGSTQYAIYGRSNFTANNIDVSSNRWNDITPAANQPHTNYGISTPGAPVHEDYAISYRPPSSGYFPSFSMLDIVDNAPLTASGFNAATLSCPLLAYGGGAGSGGGFGFEGARIFVPGYGDIDLDDVVDDVVETHFGGTVYTPLEIIDIYEDIFTAEGYEFPLVALDEYYISYGMISMTKPN